MTALALDTTSPSVSLAVLGEGEILIEYNFTSRDEVSSLLMPSLDFLLRSLQLDISQVDLFGVAVGPGLFTGIRVGLATVKGLLLDSGKPVVPVVTLRALAAKVGDRDGGIVPLIDARRQDVYAARYRAEEGVIRELDAPFLSRVGELPGRLASGQSPVFVGSGAEKYREELKGLFPQGRVVFRSHFLASEIGRIALGEFQAGRALTDPRQLAPLYLRRPDALVKQPARGPDGGKKLPHP